ncbi:NUDIX domain-containing protein [Actinocatenispora sera]|uniref:NUDIX hydrolase n=1 Tax=Actinocatenispora sera TaxID=390989 RepID=A0A810L877_9ACTN|nr:NUDIX hydrolase [Actinocatenispora sera]
MSAGQRSDYPVVEHVERPVNPVFSLVSDQVRMPDGEVARRDFLHHVGAVAAVAVDADGSVLLIRQYRHPVGQAMWELPAGLTDVAGEAPVDTARRELAEEADLTARDWQLLAELHTTPGCSDERIRVYLARDVAPVPAHERFERTAEEAGLTTRWVPLADAVAMVTTGELTNATAVAGVLAAARSRENGWTGLRPA